jgi:CRISPR system Cascade subunit CasA
MNLLTDAWIPVQHQGSYQKISLQQLLCGEQSGELCLPRDDMELACLQLLCAMTQVLFIPRDKKALGQYIREPITPEAYADACRGKMDWFDLDHPETPFMQTRGLTGKFNPINKIMAGINDGTNKTFLNDESISTVLCQPCASIFLFNHSSNCPSWCGGVKAGIRGAAPATTLLLTDTLRKTIWVNVLTSEYIDKYGYHDNDNFCWIDAVPQVGVINKIKKGKDVNLITLGLKRGLFWQPAHIELILEPIEKCSCCGSVAEKGYKNFIFEKFSYEYQGNWKHPYSPRVFEINKGEKEFRFISYRDKTPLWTQLPQIIFDNNDEKGGSEVAPVIEQLQSLYVSGKLSLIVGGYECSKATIVKRHHDSLFLSNNWIENRSRYLSVISIGLNYKNALRMAIYCFICNSIISPSKNNKEKINRICSEIDAIYYSETEGVIMDSLALLSSGIENENLSSDLKAIVLRIFDQQTKPYSHEPKMLKALALARRSLYKSLKELEPQGEAHE